jgi:hypothetical protein
VVGTAPDASPARGTVATVPEEPAAGDLVAPDDAAVVPGTPSEIVAQQLSSVQPHGVQEVVAQQLSYSSVQPHGVQEAPVLEMLGPVGGPNVEAVPMAINSLAIVVYRMESTSPETEIDISIVDGPNDTCAPLSLVCSALDADPSLLAGVPLDHQRCVFSSL